MHSHTELIDSPMHLFAHGTSLDSFLQSNLLTGFAIDCTDLEEGQRITMKHIENKEKRLMRQSLYYSIPINYGERMPTMKLSTSPKKLLII